MGEDSESGEEGGTRVSEGRTGREPEASSSEDAQPARRRQAAAMAAARRENAGAVIGNLFSKSGAGGIERTRGESVWRRGRHTEAMNNIPGKIFRAIQM